MVAIEIMLETDTAAFPGRIEAPMDAELMTAPNSFSFQNPVALSYPRKALGNMQGMKKTILLQDASAA